MIVSAKDRVYDTSYLGYRLGYEEAWARDIEHGDVVDVSVGDTVIETVAVDVGKGFILR